MKIPTGVMHANALSIMLRLVVTTKARVKEGSVVGSLAAGS